MTTGKALSLLVRPTRSADLCYPVDGIIRSQSAILLGQWVQSPSIEPSLYLGETDPNDPGLIIHTSGAIQNKIEDYILSSLRNEEEAVDLDTAILMRWNSYSSTYSPEAMAKMREIYWDDPNDSSAPQWALLRELEQKSERLHNLLSQAYDRDRLQDRVIKLQKGTNDNKATQYSAQEHVQFEGISSQTTELVEYRIPSLENSIRFLRAKLGIRMESLEAWRQAEKYGRTDRGLYNELSAIDMQIKKLQFRYLDTFITPPFDGLVTGVFRDVGDYVAAGQPVLRVENDERIYIVGTVKYRGSLYVGNLMSVSTTLFDSPGVSPMTIEGRIVSVRGHEAIDEQWDIILECGNRTAEGGAVLPINYNFDFEGTTIEV